MADAQASLMLVAQDSTSAAFNSANARLRGLEGEARRASTSMSGSFRNFGSAISSVRTALASFGIVLSGRALFSWMSRAVEATQAVGAQREEVLRAKQAFAEFHAASDSLAESLAVRLQPAISAMARVLNELRKARDDGGTPAEIIEDRVERAKRELASLEQSINAPFREQYQSAERRAEQDARARQLRENIQVLEAAQGKGQPELEFIDEEAIGRRRIGVNKIAEMLAEAREKEKQAAIDAERDLVDAVALERERFAGEEREAAEESSRIAFEKAEKRRELLAQDVEDLRFSLLSETEAEIEAHARRQEMLDVWLSEDLSREETHARLSTELARRTEKNIADIRRREMQSLRQARIETITSVAGLFSALGAISAASANESKKKFEQDKKIQRASAIVNTFAGVTQALAAYPPPASFIWAAAVAAFGLAQVRSINSTTWQGGEGGLGAVGGGGAGGGVAAAEPPSTSLPLERSEARQQTVVALHIHGNVIGAGGKAELGEYFTELLRDHVSKTDDVLIQPNSRNGTLLSGRG